MPEEPIAPPGAIRCGWAGDKPEMIAYHDTEWGVPVHDDRVLFEFLTLEAAQAGLSWLTVLRKRAGYRKAFAEFDPTRVARFDARRVEKLMADPGIIRNRAKILAAITNARCFLEVQAAFGSFDRYVWDFVGGRPQVTRLRTMGDIRATSPESDALAKDLKRRGFKFLGSTVMYAHMQATGMVNDHVVDCFRFGALAPG
ncbi:MAG: DNA-3-methyladenine glycosylase I [Gammaproteobacteria bacterium]